jgi:hypothetical protein
MRSHEKKKTPKCRELVTSVEPQQDSCRPYISIMFAQWAMENLFLRPLSQTRHGQDMSPSGL